MNQQILFNDDFMFDKKLLLWSATAMISGQVVTIHFHSNQLNKLREIDQKTQFDLEETAELWLEENELESNEIHIYFNY